MIDAGNSYAARAWFGHNARWDYASDLWVIDAIGQTMLTGFCCAMRRPQSTLFSTHRQAQRPARWIMPIHGRHEIHDDQRRAAGYSQYIAIP